MLIGALSIWVLRMPMAKLQIAKSSENSRIMLILGIFCNTLELTRKPFI